MRTEDRGQKTEDGGPKTEHGGRRAAPFQCFSFSVFQYLTERPGRARRSMRNTIVRPVGAHQPGQHFGWPFQGEGEFGLVGPTGDALGYYG